MSEYCDTRNRNDRYILCNSYYYYYYYHHQSKKKLDSTVEEEVSWLISW